MAVKAREMERRREGEGEKICGHVIFPCLHKYSQWNEMFLKKHRPKPWTSSVGEEC